MPSSQTINVITVQTAPAKSVSTRGGAAEAAVRQTVEKALPVETLAESFNRFMTGLGQVLAVGQTQVGGLVLDEITFSVEIGADGEFRLLGTGVGVEASSSLTFTLRRG
ncbi:MAG: hypothetical protein D6790_05355, partial [Caldilineae bacterium]